MPMQSAMDPFMHEMGEHLQETQDKQAQQAIQQHIQNLEQCFQMLGSQPQRATCAAVQGLKTEHDSFLKENPSPDILTLFDLGAASKTERYEIVSYTGLIEKSKLMGQRQVADLLQQNLQQEQAMLQRVTQAGQQLGQQMLGRANMGQMGQSSQSTATNPWGQQTIGLSRWRWPDPPPLGNRAIRGAHRRAPAFQEASC